MIQQSTIKSAVALCAAWSFGLWTGINYIGSLVDPQVGPGMIEPEWVATAEMMAQISIVLLALSVASWIYLDFREEETDIDTSRIKRLLEKLD